MMLTEQDFRDRVERFLTEANMPPTSFGKAVLNDPNFVFELRKGRSPSLRMVERVDEFIAANTPNPRQAEPAEKTRLAS